MVIWCRCCHTDAKPLVIDGFTPELARLVSDCFHLRREFCSTSYSFFIGIVWKLSKVDEDSIFYFLLLTFVEMTMMVGEIDILRILLIREMLSLAARLLQIVKIHI